MREYALDWAEEFLRRINQKLKLYKSKNRASSIKEAIAKIRGIKKRLAANSLTLVSKSKTKIEQQSGP